MISMAVLRSTDLSTTGLTAFSFALIRTWLVGLGFTLATPERGPHDRIAGTYLVPK